VATLAPIRAQLERGISAAEFATADSKLAAAKRSPADETSEAVCAAPPRRPLRPTRTSRQPYSPLAPALTPTAAVAQVLSDETGYSSRESVVRSFLIDELQSHGRVAEGDQLHELLDEVRTIMSSAAFRITLDDLLQSGFETAAAQLHRASTRPADGRAPTSSLNHAKVLAQYNKLAASTLSDADVYAMALLEVPALQELCWIVYTGE
jgi:hypothetical protein